MKKPEIRSNQLFYQVPFRS